MKYINILGLLLVLFSCNRKENDLHSSGKLDIHFNEAYNLNLSKEDRIRHADSANFIVNGEPEGDSLKIKNVFKVANRYFTLLEYDKYFKVSKKALQLSEEKKDTLQIAKAEYYLGDYYFYKFKNDSAYYYYLKAKEKYEKSTDNYNLANITLSIARVLLFEKDFLGSEIQTIRALKTAKRDNEDGLIYQCYDNLGRVLEGQKNYEKSLEYYYQSLEQLNKDAKNVNSSLLEVQTYNNIGHVYLNAKSYNKALEIYNKALKINGTKELHPSLYASVLSLYAYTNFKLNKNAIDDFNTALRIRDSINDIAGKINSRIHLTEYYLAQKDTLKAKKLNKEAYLLAKESKYNKEVLTTLDFFTKIEPKKGLQYAQEYIKLSDSLQLQERATRNKLARIEFETDEIILEKELVSNQNKLLFYITISLLAFGILLYIILSLRAKERVLLLKQKQQKANEEIYNLMLDQQIKINEVRNFEKDRIAKELHDGVMNKLASTRLNLYVLQKRRDDVTIEKCIAHINQIQNIEKEIRSIAHELNNEVFNNSNNFKSILEELIQEQNKLFSTQCKLVIQEDINWESFDTKIKMNIFRIIQEALNNINKYAKATRACIKINSDGPTLSLLVEDNGIGFNVAKTRKGIGLKNMKERANAINGNLVVDSEKDQGTTIILKIAV